MVGGLIELVLDPLGVGVSPASVHSGGELGRVETMEHSLDDKELELVGLDEDVTAAGEADAACARPEDNRVKRLGLRRALLESLDQRAPSPIVNPGASWPRASSSSPSTE
jgi:hypothetical protein